MKLRNNKGFTIIELMIVIAILSIIFTVGINFAGRMIDSVKDEPNQVEVIDQNQEIQNETKTTENKTIATPNKEVNKKL